MAIQAILFDADGVVIIPNRFSDYMEKELRLPKTVTQPFFEGVFLDCLVGRADMKDIIVPYLHRWGWRNSVNDFLTCWFDLENVIDQRILKAIKTLRQRGYFCALATNQERHRVAYMKSEMGFSELFDEIFSSSAIGAMKNDPRYFEIVTAELGLSEENILFWDDSQSNVEVARLFGWNAERYTTFDGFEKTMRVYLALE